MTTTFDLILYHADCVDGFTAAWVAKKACPDAELIACTYDGKYVPMSADDLGSPWYLSEESSIKNLLADCIFKSVLVVDFSFKRDVLLALHERTEGRLLVLDHHKTAAKELEGLDFCVFDMERSGARMALDHFWPRADGSEIREAPPDSMESLVNYVQDRDLWRWKLPRSREVSAAIGSYPFMIEAWDNLAQRFLTTDSAEALACAGADILRYQERLIEQIAKHAAPRPIGGEFSSGVRVLSVNSPVLQSELGNLLSDGHPFAAVYFVDEHGDEIWSLRSREGGADVSEIARSFGGGGHKHAAGFTRRR